MRKLLLAGVVVSSSLVGCAASSGDASDLPDTLVDGAADSWASPTAFGNLFNQVWQRGEFRPSDSVKYPSWKFSLSGDASVHVFTRQAPTDEPDLTNAQLYLYKHDEDAGAWKRIAKGTSGDWGTITKDLGEGSYRVLAKAASADDEGQFLLRMECTGRGCASRDQCLMGDGEFWEVEDVHDGALLSSGNDELTSANMIQPQLAAQIIAAVNESSNEVTTLAEAFDAVDGNVVNRYRFWDNLQQRTMIAIEYGAGDNSYGAFFVEDSATVAAGIHDGFIENCTVAPKMCVFGETMGEAEFMPGMKLTADDEYSSPEGIDELTAQQIIKAVDSSEATTLADAIANVDEGTVYVRRYTHEDGRKFVEVQFHAGDNPVGAFYRDGSADIVATNSDGDLGDCTETY